MSVGKGFADRYLTHEETSLVVQEGLGTLAVDGKRVLVIIPDGTRTIPMPLMYDLFEAHLALRVAALDYLVALGTHPIMNDEQLSKLVGRPEQNGQCGKSRILNHHWEDPQIFVTLGVIPAAEIGEFTGGLLAQEVPVRLNKLIHDYDQLIICGPVFPHEVVGFSGGK
jgi:nickel-dependent lactate racemase